MDPTRIKQIFTDVDVLIYDFEQEHGAQPEIRHWGHLMVAKAEQVAGVPAGTFIPAGGVKPPNSN